MTERLGQPRAPKGDVTVKVDPKLKKTYDALVATIEETSAEEARDFDRRWEAAGTIVDDELYILGGFASADAFYRAVMKEEPRNARRYMRVAKDATPDEERDYGSSKLDAALGFIEAKLGHALVHPPLPIAFERLRIPVAHGTKDLENASVPEVAAATSKLTASWHKKPKIDSLADVRVHEHAGVLSFTGVPLAAIHHFIRALTAAKLPVVKVKPKKR